MIDTSTNLILFLEQIFCKPSIHKQVYVGLEKCVCVCESENVIRKIEYKYVLNFDKRTHTYTQTQNELGIIKRHCDRITDKLSV